MKTAALLGIMGVMGVMILAGCGSRSETAEAKRWRWAKEAEASAPEVCSNFVTGITRVVSHQINSTDGDFHKWKGFAVVEFVNRVGGVERTNVPLAVRVGSGLDNISRGSCLVDDNELLARELELIRVRAESKFSVGN